MKLLSNPSFEQTSQKNPREAANFKRYCLRRADFRSPDAEKKIDQLDPFRLTTDDAEVQLEALIGQLAGLHAY